MLIGSGQIGSRHLQGLVKLKFDSSIEVIDPSKKSQRLAKNRLKEVQRSKYIKSISFHENIEDSSPSTDLVIVATSSEIRKKVVVDLLKNRCPKYMILEKFAFQKVDDYQFILQLLKTKKIKCYINCPNRAFQSYIKVKKIFSKEGNITIEVDGGDWNLASNLIHYLDLINFLTHSKIQSLEGEALSKRIYNSKRQGYKEFSGLVSGFTKRGDNFVIRHRKNSKRQVTLTFTSENNQIKVFESQSKAIFNKRGSNLNLKEIDFPIVNQSDLTTELVHDLFFNDNCSLITIKDSYHIHELVINLFLDHLKKVLGRVYKRCPIT
jgi:hypothetical protein